MVGRFAIVFILALVTISSANAQVVDPVDFSIKGGVNYADLAIDPDTGADNELFLRFGGGASLGMNLTPNVSITADVLYLMKGKKVVYRSGNDLDQSEIEAHTELNYVVLNPNFRLGAGRRTASPYLIVGPEIGILMNAEAHTAMDGEESYKEDVKDSFKSTDFGLSFGGGIDFSAGGTGFFIEGRYAMGLVDISKSDDSSTSGETKVSTRGIYAFGGIRF